MNVKIVDKDSKDYFVNGGEFRMFHHERDLAIDPGTVYRIKADPWLRGQPVIRQTDENGVDLPAKAEKAEAKGEKAEAKA